MVYSNDFDSALDFFKCFFSVLSLTSVLAGCGSGSGNEIFSISPEQILELRTKSSAFSNQDAGTLQSNPAAMTLAQVLLNAHCASCHGDDGRSPSRGIPNLATGVFDYGDSIDAVRTTILQGRHSVMPKFGGKMGEVDLGAVTAYVQAFSTGEKNSTFQGSAQRLYAENCLACHGAEGHGNRPLGVPDLGDGQWQHGSNMMNIRLAITRGTESDCPAHRELSAAELELLTAYVVHLRSD